jgi:charged multivesicular body protein 6
MVDRAILDLKLQRDKLHQYSRRIQTVLNREKELAKEALTRGEKQKALLILRRRKYQEQVLVKADQQLETLEQLVPTQ